MSRLALRSSLLLAFLVLLITAMAAGQHRVRASDEEGEEEETASPAAAATPAAPVAGHAKSEKATHALTGTAALDALAGKTLPAFKIVDVTAAIEEPKSADNDNESEALARRRRRRRQGDELIRLVRIRFSRPTSLGDVHGGLVTIPDVALDWDQATQESADVIKLPGGFVPGSGYDLVASHRFLDTAQDAIIAPAPVSFRMPTRPLRLAFVELGPVMERDCQQNIHLAIRNIERLTLETARLPLHMLLPGAPPVATEGALTPMIEGWNKRAATLREGLGGEDSPFGAFFAPAGELESEIFSEPGATDRDRRASLRLDWRKSAKVGATYVVRGVSAEEKKTAATPLTQLQITDLAISYKVCASQILVWVTRMKDASIVPGARVFVATKDSHLVAAGETDKDGLVRLADGQSLASLDLSGRNLVTATTGLTLSSVARIFAIAGKGTATAPGDDTAWIDVGSQLVAIPGRIPHTEKSQELTRAHVFTERGIYRPGDTVHFKATIRRFDAGTASLPAGLPAAGGTPPSVHVRVRDAKETLVCDLVSPLTAFGTASGSFPVRLHQPLGQWTLDVFDTTGSTKLGTTDFRVEEFVAPRHKVDVTFKAGAEDHKESAPAPTAKDVPPAVVSAIIRATYYAGGPVKHGKVRWRVSLAAAKHPLDDPKGYVAGTEMAGESELLESGEATLDGGGAVVLDLPVSGAVADGRRSLEVNATALDFDGRAASGTGTYTYSPRYLVGLQDHEQETDEGAPIDLKAVVVDRTTGKALTSGTLIASQLEEKWVSIQKRNDDGDFYWAWEPVMTPGVEMTAAIEGQTATFKLHFARGGRHQVLVSFKADDGRTYSSTTSFQVPWGTWYDEEGGGGPEWQAEKLHKLSARADKKEYLPGETAHIRLHADRAPKDILVTVEREGILDVRHLTLPAGQDSFDLPIQETYAPNAFVSVLAVHGREGFPVYATEADTLAPSYSHGYASLQVRGVHSGLKVAFTGAGSSAMDRPGARHAIGVKVTDSDGKPAQAEVALAVVDESVLALTDFATPSLDTLFDAALPLMVRTGDLRRGLTYQTPYRVVGVHPLTGGDGGNGALSRTRKYFDPVALFAPSLVTDTAGETKVEFVLPDTMTTYRVYAVVVDKGSRHGSAAEPLLVRKPFYIEPGLPRFFTDGDKARFFVAVFNGTGAAGSVSLTATTSAGLTLTPPREAVPVADGDRATIPVDVRASLEGRPAQAAAARVVLTGTMGAATDSVELTEPIRPRTVMRTSVAQGGVHEAVATAKLALPAEAGQLSSEMLASASARIEVSGLQTLQIVGALKYLLKYPYGCIEQTSSALLPVAVLRDLIKRGMVPGMKVEDTDRFLSAGIERVLSMQTASGGFGYWPGNTNAHPYGSAYATLALALAAKAGGDVPSIQLNRALDYLERVATGKEDGAMEAEALSRYVLSLYQRAPGDKGRSLGEALRKNWPSWRRREETLLLLLSWAQSGETDKARRELTTLLSGESDATRKKENEGEEPSWEFDPMDFATPLRETALELVAILDIDPRNAHRDALAAKLLKNIGSGGTWSSTHESGWAVMALGRYLEDSVPSDAPMSASITPPGASPVKLDFGARQTQELTLAPAGVLGGTPVSIEAHGANPVYYRLTATFPWLGPDVDPAKALVQRHHKRMAGEGPIRVGDLVEVEVIFPVRKTLHYLAVDDPMPAGLVAVNTNLKTEEQVPHREPESDWDEGGTWISPLWASYQELHDDRVTAFSDYVWRGRYRMSYVARAVCAGTFAVPPATVEPMYQPEKRMYSPPAVVTIEPAEGSEGGH